MAWSIKFVTGHQVRIIEYVHTATLDIRNYSNSIFILAKELLELYDDLLLRFSINPNICHMLITRKLNYS